MSTGDDLPDIRELEREERGRGAVRTLLLLLAALAVVWGLTSLLPRGEGGPPDLAPSYSRVLPLDELNPVEGGYVGRPSAGWAGFGDEERARSDCEALARALHLRDGETVTLLDAEGLPAVECGEP